MTSGAGAGAAVGGSIDATAIGPVTPTVEASLCGSGAAVDGSIEAIAIGPVTPLVADSLCSLMSSESLIIWSMWSILTPSSSACGPA